MNPVGSYKRGWNLIPRGIQESRFGNVILNSGTFNHSLRFIHCLTFARNMAIHLATLLRVSVNAECSATAAYKVQSRSNDHLTTVEKFLSSNIQYHLFIFFLFGDWMVGWRRWAFPLRNKSKTKQNKQKYLWDLYILSLVVR